jgi:hypothetical protein
MLTGQMEFYNGVPIFSPNDTFALTEKGCYVSYNNCSISDYGSDTTALVRINGVEPTKFLILNGNHLAEYALLESYDACVEYFKEHLSEQNKMSDNWDEEIIMRKDGSLFVQKIEENKVENIKEV